MWIETGLKAPAFELAGPAPKDGEKGRSAIVFAHLPPPGAEVRLKLSPGWAAGLPDQGVIVVVVWFGPQVGGLLRTARAPPTKERSNEVKGTCGASVTVVDRCPVSGAARTWPTSGTDVP
jgi:hypothetical protein